MSATRSSSESNSKWVRTHRAWVFGIGYLVLMMADKKNGEGGNPLPVALSRVPDQRLPPTGIPAHLVSVENLYGPGRTRTCNAQIDRLFILEDLWPLVPLLASVFKSVRRRRLPIPPRGHTEGERLKMCGGPGATPAMRFYCIWLADFHGHPTRALVYGQPVQATPARGACLLSTPPTHIRVMVK